MTKVKPKSLFATTVVPNKPAFETRVIDGTSPGIEPLMGDYKLTRHERQDNNSGSNTLSFDLESLDGSKIVLYGNEIQDAMGKKLDEILAELTKGNSPVLFELFQQLKKGVELVDLPSLENKIRSAQNTNIGQRLLQSIGLSSAAKRLQNASEEISTLLTSKSKNLLDLTSSMEQKLGESVAGLINDANKLAKLAMDYSASIKIFEDYVKNGKEILTHNLAIAEQKRLAAQSGEPLVIQDSKSFDQKVELFQNRLLALEISYNKTFVELENIRLMQGAGFQVLAETASASKQEFNDIKGELIKLSVAHKLEGVQALGDQRRQLLNSLNQHGTNTLEKVAVKAAKAQGDNRLEDATRLINQANKLKTIGDKVLQEKENNKQKFAEVREKLAQTRETLKTTK